MQRILRHFLPIVIATYSVASYAVVDDSGAKIKWGYTGNIGPSRWAELAPAFTLCATGKTQSPINISAQTKVDQNALKITYQPAPLIIMDNGDTVLMLGNKQALINDGHGIQLNFPGNDANQADELVGKNLSSGFNSPHTPAQEGQMVALNIHKEAIQLDGEEYRLIQFHFHTPSENQIKKRAFPLEIHFVHQGPEGKVAVIGVLVNEGQANSEVQKIIDNLPTDEGKEHVLHNVRINPANLLPAQKSYYRFVGSLTTPPCIEGVQWLVMADTITVSSGQVQRLRQALDGNNARPVQPLNGREISYSMEKK